MKNVFILFIFLLSTVAYSQSLSLFDIDATNFPTIRGKFYAFDGAGKQQRPNIGELSITENGTVRTITNVSCPPPQPPKAISSVLVFDVSGSMSRVIGNSTNMDIAKAAARLWVNSLPLGISECAITSFDHTNYLLQDFTTDRLKLLNSISTLTPNGGTNYDAALLNPNAGGLLISQKGKYKKVIIFLTDGSAPEPKKELIIQEANNQNCSIYCITVGISTPQVLKEIANQTGGQIFENVTSVKEVEEVYNRILQISQGGDACTIEWTSGISCQTVQTTARLDWQNLEALSYYQPPNTSVASLEFNPNFLRFENPPIGVPESQTVTLTARNVAFTVSNITSSNTAFTISPSSFTLQPNQSQMVTVTYTAVDSGNTFTSFSVENNFCPQTYYASGGYKGVKTTKPTLKLTHPNGGENFIVGSDTVIRWEGIPPTELVQLEYSIDNGKSWYYIDTTRGLTYNWKKVPKPASSNCVFRIKQIEPTNSDTIKILRGHNGTVHSVKFSPDGSIVASSSSDRTIKLWDVESGELIRTLTGHKQHVGCISFSPDGQTLASGCSDGTIKFWNVATGVETYSIAVNSNKINTIDYHPDGNILAFNIDNIIKLWDVNSNLEIGELGGHAERVRELVFSPDNNTLASGGNDDICNIWDINSRQLQRSISGHTSDILSLVYSPDGTILASGSEDRTTKLWDPLTGKEILTLKGDQHPPYCLAINPEGNLIAVEGLGISLSNPLTGQYLRKLNGYNNSIYGMDFSSDGRILAFGGSNYLVYLLRVEMPVLQEDQSDSLFSIVEPISLSTSINMGEVMLGSSKDSVVIDFIKNVGSWKFDVNSIRFRGWNNSSFSLVSGIPKYTVEVNKSHFGEFRFTPNRVGVHTAEIVIITQSDTIIQTITGIGVEPQLQILANFIDFGEVEIGNERVITDTLVLKNVSTTPITIDDTKLLSPDIEQFEILSGGGNFTLNAGDERPVTAKFKPKFVGRTSGRIGFEYNGVGSPAIAQLFGSGIGGLVYVPNDSGYPGDRKSIRLVLANVKPEGIASIASKFRATIRLKNSLVAPLDGSSTIIQNDSMYITVNGTIGTTTELAQIPIIVGLGAIEYTYIDIVEFRLEDNNGNPVEYNFETSSGIFMLLGICREGGSRLVFDNAVPYLLMVTPNPSDGNVEVDVNVIEEGTSALKIFNANGSLMEERIFTTLGNKKIAIDTKEYSNGLYFITLQTPTTFDKTKMLLVK